MNTIIVIGFLAIIGIIIYNMMTKKETVEQAAVDTTKEIVAAAEPVVEKVVETVVAEVKAEAPVVETKVEEVAAAVETKAEKEVVEIVAKIKKPRAKKAK